jgi:hypothetical protein
VKTETKLLVALCVVCVLLVGSTIFFVKKYSEATKTIADKQAIISQNQQAYQDDLKQKLDSIQVLAVKVDDLNSQVSAEKQKTGYYAALSGRLLLQIDSLHASGQGITSSGTDQSGEYKEVDFKGKTGILNYSGWTRFYMPPSVAQSIYRLDATFDSIMVTSSLYQDADKLWKIRTESQTSGVNLLASYTIDSKIYVGMRDIVEENFEKAKNTLPPFGLRARLAGGIKTDDIKHAQFNSLLFDGSLEAFWSHYSVMYYPTTGVVSAGVFYILDVGGILKTIF